MKQGYFRFLWRDQSGQSETSREQQERNKQSKWAKGQDRLLLFTS